MQFIDLIKDALQQFISELSTSSLLLAVVDRQTCASLQEFTHKEIALWKASRKCIVSDCQNVAIRRSHTLQKAGPLTHIAENNWLLTPRFDAAAIRVKMKKITTAVASTFPGFCPRHEALFHGFEARRCLQKNIDFVLQAYRATCRETVRLRIESAYFKDHKDLFQTAVDVSCSRNWLAGFVRAVLIRLPRSSVMHSTDSTRAHVWAPATPSLTPVWRTYRF